MASIEKFGTISEDENGLLIFDGFHFDLEGESEGHPHQLIALIASRLLHEISCGHGSIVEQGG